MYWYNKGLEDTAEILREYEGICDEKYNSLIKCLSKNNILVIYDELSKEHKIQVMDDINRIYSTAERQELINRACEWLENNIELGETVDSNGCPLCLAVSTYCFTPEEFINKFRKDIKNEDK